MFLSKLRFNCYSIIWAWSRNWATWLAYTRSVFPLGCLLVPDILHKRAFGPRHDKTNTVRLRSAWIQTSLRKQTVLQVEKLIANSMDPDQTTRRHRLIWIHASRKRTMLVFVMARLIWGFPPPVQLYCLRVGEIYNPYGDKIWSISLQ
jgi:hypothetical protein